MNGAVQVSVKGQAASCAPPTRPFLLRVLDNVCNTLSATWHGFVSYVTSRVPKSWGKWRSVDVPTAA